MLFWNKIEIYSGFSKDEFTQLRSALDAAAIRYDYKLKNASQRKPSHTHQDPNTGSKYILYVHQKDYYQAMHLTSNRKREEK